MNEKDTKEGGPSNENAPQTKTAENLTNMVKKRLTS